MNRLLFAVLATSGIGLLGSNTMPLFVGALIDGLGLDETGFGLQGSLELISQYGPHALAGFPAVISVASFAILLPVALVLDRRTRNGG